MKVWIVYNIRPGIAKWNTELDTLCQRSFHDQKTQPNITPSKIIAIGWVDLDSKMKFASCHWS